MVLDTIVQLKPMENSFYDFVFGKLKRLRGIILCEGVSDVEVVKAIIRKLGLSVRDIGITDCSGVTNEPKVAQAIASLVGIARKLETIALIIDANKSSFSSRIESIVDSLRSRGVNIVSYHTIYNERVYKVVVSGKKFAIIVAINGIVDYGFSKYELEDHVIKLLLLENVLGANKLSMYTSAKELLRDNGYASINDIIELIENSMRDHVEKAFNHIMVLLKHFQ